jgi:5-hydroxyisourate hydrolase
VSRLSISTHVLDTSAGRPAEGVQVRLLRVDEAVSTIVTVISATTTNADGRVAALVPDGYADSEGTYRLLFEAGAYFAARGQETFYTTIAIEFVAERAQHYHVPLLLSPFGYSTYRGS